MVDSFRPDVPCKAGICSKLRGFAFCIWGICITHLLMGNLLLFGLLDVVLQPMFLTDEE